MRAARLHGYKNIRIDEIEAPQPGQNQLVVDVVWCGMCGSDLHAYLNPENAALSNRPMALGHEIAGRVRNPPPSSRFKHGDAVFVDPRVLCRSCSYCKAGKGHICKNIGFIGSTKKESGGVGGYSESVVVHEGMLHKLPREIAIEYAAIIEPLSIVWHAVKTSGITEWTKKSVLVIGGGPIGFALLLCLRAVGASIIVVSEPTKTRRKQLVELATAVVNPITEDVVKKCRDLTSGEGVDAVFDCAGVQSALDSGFQAVRSEGVFVMVAVWKAQMVVPSWELLYKHVTLKGSLTIGNGEIAEVMQMMAEGKLRGYEKMVTGRIQLADIAKRGFEELVDHKDDHIKILVTPRL